MTKWEMLEKLVACLGEKQVLEELVRGLSTDLAKEHLEFIMRMNDIK